ncbi:MAG: hypothetical protein MSIBF_04835 [Candidatus Altiarchaeales archaeon IMC4]|nr:MAG: hypothetical protein MSIBF_04835 [Candidatus Altiarchaeales archaeon IMC4]
MSGIALYSSASNNTLTNNTANNNKENGFYVSSNSTGNTLNANIFCSNNQSGGAFYDIYDGDSNTGDNNTCSTTTYNYNDTGIEKGCTNRCDGTVCDADNDYYVKNICGGTDCNDDNISINPGMPEIYYNGVDDDCNTSTIDNDQDGDGFNQTVDCNDTNAFIKPGAREVFDRIDNNCDGNIDVLIEFGATYGTTNFSAVSDIGNVTNITLANGNGTIQFPADYGVNATGEDYDSNVEIGDGFVSVNSSGLNPTFNNTVNITLNNVVCPATIYYASGTFASKGEIIAGGNVCNATTDPSCSIISCAGGTLKFTVSHFTGFAAIGTTNMTIWDETDSGMPYGNQTKYQDEQVVFFANYTNSTQTIQGANCAIGFQGGSYNMVWNASSRLYEYNRSFSLGGTYEWNVTCNGSALGYETLNANDSVSIFSDRITLEGGWNLISLPLNPITPYTAETFLNQTGCDLISRYAGGIQTHIKGTSNFNFNVTPGYGYYTYCQNPGNKTITGTPVSGVNISLTTGWNLIGSVPEAINNASALRQT